MPEMKVITYLQSLERRADRHLARSDDLLVRAVMRVWKARERSELFERTRVKRSLVQSWNTWKAKLQKLDQMEGKFPFFLEAFSPLIPI
jgi:protein SFI1